MKLLTSTAVSRCIYLLVLITSCTASHADDVSAHEHYERLAIEKKLWLHQEWLNLLHYSGDGESVDDYVSSIRDKHFFLAEDGSNNPGSELLATLTGFYDTDARGDDNAQCIYVARRQWLTARLDIDPESLPKVDCQKYDEWRKNIKPETATLIFPTYHLNSPSSMFGHTLIRLDPAEDKGESKWLSVAVNFGANTPQGENSILYAYKGLAGGYPGIFVTDYYYKKIQEYNRIEHRDIWEYRLNLTPEETERIVTHLWELQDINFDYYFFDENCSYRLLELLEIARPGTELTDEYILTAIPIDTVKSIEEIGMIESVEYRPARATTLAYMLEQIPEQHHELAIRLSEDFETSKTPAFKNLTQEEQRQIIEIAYKYLRYQQAEEGRKPEVAKRSFQLLKLRNQYPEGGEPIVPAPVSPEKGHGSKRTTFSAGRRLDNYYGEFGFKMSFHDLEDNEHGFLQGASINIGSLQIRAEENESLSLYRLDFVDIFSLAPRTDFFKPVAWRVYTGFERQYTKGIDQLTYHVTGGGGGNWNYLENHQAYVLATGRLEINKQFDNAIEPGIGFISGLLSHFGSNTARLEASGEHFTDDMYRLRVQYTHNFVISTNHSLKIYAKYEWQEKDTEFSDINLSYQYYF